MAKTADVLVVGLGAMGSAALYQCARLGARAIGIDRFAPPHDRGSSHGDTRITRQAIGEGREFVPLVLRSNRIWEELEAATGRSLMVRNGVLILSAADLVSDHHGSRSFLADTVAAAREFGIAHEVLSAGEVRRRFPQFRVSAGEQGYFEPGAGYLRPELCIETQLDTARRRGAEVRTGETVLAVEPAANGVVEVRTERDTYSAAQVILTTGPWISHFLSAELHRHFRVYRQVLCWFALARNFEQYAPERFPTFIWITGVRPRDMMYGFAAVDGPAGGLKTATEQYEGTVDPDAVNREISDGEVAAMYSEYVGPRFPDVAGQCVRAKTCLYTVTPDAKFVIDRLPGADNVIVASACSGHGFKHSAAVGEALADLALQRPPALDLAPFRWARLQA